MQTPSRKQITPTSEASESSGLIFVSTERKVLSDGREELEPVLISFFCAVKNFEAQICEETSDGKEVLLEKEPLPVEEPSSTENQQAV